MNRQSDRANQVKPAGILYRLLRLFTVMYPGEAPTAFLLTFNVFLLFLAYYIIKPVRDALMLESWPAEVNTTKRRG